MNQLIFYIIFSYLFEIGVSTGPGKIPWHNIVFAPIFMPLALGRFCAYMINK